MQSARQVSGLYLLVLVFASALGFMATAPLVLAADSPIPLPSKTCDPSIQSCAPDTTPPPAPTPTRTCNGGGTGATSCSGADTAPASQNFLQGINVGGGNPINLFTGNKYQRETDMAALPGVLGLEIVRHYNSTYSSENSSLGLLGRGWKLSYETALFVIGRTVQIIQADGTRLIFNRDPKDPSTCASTNPAFGSIKVSKTVRGEEFTWIWRNGRRLQFNVQGQLTQILAPTGEFVNLQYDPSGALLSVVDPQGRKLQLHYLDNKTARSGQRFSGVQSIDSPVGRFTFAYGSALPKGSTLPASATLANLVEV
ncbi:MAG: hypothetical protein K2X63_08030, partial [Burkholderiaceae bacterium]|nr:hypothetical protein [Burkholderiaceae bacterium]